MVECYESLNYNKAVRTIMELADSANQYIDSQKPWTLAKLPDQQEQVQAVCTQGLNLFKILSTYLKPILTSTARKVEQFLNCEPLDGANIKTPLLGCQINKFEPLIQRSFEIYQLNNPDKK